MAKRSAQDTAAAKAKKQKMILIVGGVLLLAVAAFQVPKLMKGSGSAAALRRLPVGCTPSVARHTRAGRGRGRPHQGLRRRRRRCPAARRGRQGGDEPARIVHALRGQGSVRPAGRRGARPPTPRHRPSDQNGAAPPADTAPARRAGRPAPRPPTPDGDGTAPPAPTIYATIDFNTKPQQVQVKGTFPTPEPLFVLRSLTKKQAKISVAGGSFDGGQARDPEARQEGDARQHGDRRPLRAEARLHRRRSPRSSRDSRPRRQPATTATTP